MRRPAPLQPQQTSPKHPALDYRPPGYFLAIKWGALVVALLAVACALYVGIWFYTAGQLRDGVVAWAEARRAEGVTVGYTRLDIGGFPFALRMRVEAPSLSSPQGKWEAAALTARMRPWSPNRVTVRAPGEHRFTWLDGGGSRTFLGQVQTAAARLQLDGGRVRAADLTIRDFKLSGPGDDANWAVGRATIAATYSPVPGADPDTPTFDLRLRLANLRVPDKIGLPLGPAVEALEINAGLMGSLAGGPIANALTQWRDAGGTIEIRRLNVTHGPLVLNADGTLALDGALQPVGAFTARIEGFFETVDGLKNRGLIRSRDAVTAKMVLGVLARRMKNGRTALTLPISVQDRRLFAGPIPLIDIPEITWKPRVRTGN